MGHLNKFIIFTIFVSISLILGCGQNQFNNQEENKNVHIMKIQEQYFVEVELYVPEPLELGGATTISYRDDNYLIDPQTSNKVKNIINSHSPGTYTKKIKGIISQKSGLFPNPTVMWNVVNISDIQ